MLDNSNQVAELQKQIEELKSKVSSLSGPSSEPSLMGDLKAKYSKYLTSRKSDDSAE